MATRTASLLTLTVLIGCSLARTSGGVSVLESDTGSDGFFSLSQQG